MTLHIDGESDQDDCLFGISPKDPRRAPWWVFDDEKQDYVAGPYQWQWLARWYIWRHPA